MKNRTGASKGFSLVELLAVVLILAVLAAVAVPLYLNTRKTSAARACKANINAIASAEAAYALRNGAYATMATLAATGPESLSSAVKCPLDNSNYILNSTAVTTGTGDVTTGSTAAFFICCPNASEHNGVLGGGSVIGDWQRPMAAITAETTP
jgi:type IV pilus assembly protein PilA